MVDAALCPCSDPDCTNKGRRMKTWSMIELRPGQGAGEVDAPNIPPSVAGSKAGLQAPTAPIKIPKGMDAPTLQGHRAELDLRPSLPQALRRP
ncbi:MAG: hypothetical protein CMH53_01920 [Myxococcales bacterium]|nr:hypothetical protein [Myxococcales bacterium]